MRLFGSFLVFSLVFLAFMPDILAQKDLRLAASLSVLGLGAGGLSPGLPGFALLYEARPFAFKPPFGSLPALRVQAGDLATKHRHVSDFRECQDREVLDGATGSQEPFSRNKQTIGKRRGPCRCVQL